MRKNLILLFFVGAILFACSKVPVTGRKQMSLLPESIMLSLSLDSYNQFLQQNPPAPENLEETKMVKRVGARMATAVENYLKDNGFKKRLKNFQWEFNYVQQDIVNAWCMPGGKVVVYQGIMPICKDDKGLAVVMGHEIAHAVARHGNERMSQQLAIALGGVSLSVALKEKPQETQQIFMAAYGVTTGVGALAFSRNQESEADKMGAVFMALAGYNPSETIEFWKRMDAMANGPKVPEFLSTHPSHERRIKDLEEYLPVAMTYYNPQN
ncbi:MAG TPA: peptidase M48 [Flavobacteriales bacterium]|nr:peptidase M48 [Flavobacteriales bacterium]|tara:strand:+ start:68410 stop:69213 length:804 start_codon:yes stop_codon:yes gene_type:complete